MGITYTAAAARGEVLNVFRVAARFGAPVHVHLRYAGDKTPETARAALEEVLTASGATKAPLHVVHVTSMGLRDTPQLLAMLRAAKAQGTDVTTECYPYVAGSTGLESALFDPGWQERMRIGYGDLQWVKTGERLTAATFERYRKEGGQVVIFMIPESVVRLAVADPMVMIASDGMPSAGASVHPRGQGTFSRVLGKYVREEKALDLMTALRKMTLMPAQRLEQRAPAFKTKGRIKLGADADITVFDANRVIDGATFEKPLQYSDGIRFVLVNGVAVVSDGKLVGDVFPGRVARAPQTPAAGLNWRLLNPNPSLDGWSVRGGKASFTVAGQEIVGRSVLGSPNSFLITDATFGDFILEYDAKVDPRLNAGVMVRAERRRDYRDGVVFGYQVEIDSSARAWSGGIYDEQRREWLNTLARNAQARAAFKIGEWNHFRVEALGNRIRTFVNGVAAANLIDDMTPRGFIGLQVHSVDEGPKLAGLATSVSHPARIVGSSTLSIHSSAPR